MRTSSQIKEQIEHLQSIQKIANTRLKEAIEQRIAEEEIYWEKAVIQLSGMIFGLEYSLGIVD